jgi:hypothetical protein
MEKEVKVTRTAVPGVDGQNVLKIPLMFGE